MNPSSQAENNPPHRPTLSPHLVCANAIDALDFYVRAFGAIEQMRLAMPDGKLMHAALSIGDSILMLMEENPQWGMLSPTSLHGTPVTIHISVADVDAAIQRAADAGATVTMPPADMFWGERYGQVKDPFGHAWSLATHQRHMTIEEIQQAARNAPMCGG